MNTVLDIYVRIIIALITFVVPFIIFSLTNYRKFLDDQLKQWERKEVELLNEADREMEGQQTDTKAKLHRSSAYKTRLDKIEKDRDAELIALNPKIQFIWIFSSLSLALAIICLDFLVRDGVLAYSHILSLILITASAACFLLAVYRIVKVIFKLIGIMVKKEDQQ